MVPTQLTLPFFRLRPFQLQSRLIKGVFLTVDKTIAEDDH
jgi:hypothetical protein